MVQCNASKKNHPIFILRKSFMALSTTNSPSKIYQRKLSPVLRIHPKWLSFFQSLQLVTAMTNSQMTYKLKESYANLIFPTILRGNRH